jgi:hypothetical protein
METVIMMREEELFARINQIVDDRIRLLTETKLPNEVPESLDTQQQMAKFLDVTVQCLIRWRKRGKIPFTQAGSRIMYDRAAVLKALKGKGKYK